MLGVGVLADFMPQTTVLKVLILVALICMFNVVTEYLQAVTPERSGTPVALTETWWAADGEHALTVRIIPVVVQPVPRLVPPDPLLLIQIFC